MGQYDIPIDWMPDQLTTIVPGFDDKPARLAWNGAGIVSTEFAREFIIDLSQKCDRVDKENDLTLDMWTSILTESLEETENEATQY